MHIGCQAGEKRLKRSFMDVVKENVKIAALAVQKVKEGVRWRKVFLLRQKEVKFAVKYWKTWAT